jgi:hypothetical protein
MSKTVLISLLSKGSNGDEILSILDSFTSDFSDSDDVNQPTLEEIEF